MKINLTPIELIDQLRAWFHPKDRVVTLSDDQWISSKRVAWETAVSKNLALPGLVGFWPMSSVQRSTGNVYDVSGQGRTLTYNGNPVFSVYGDFAPYAQFDGTGDYFSRADETDLDILGTETIFPAAFRGLTMGGWFYGAGTGTLMGKATAAAAAGYLMIVAATQVQFYVESNVTFIYSDTGTMPDNTWRFCVSRYIPSTEQAVFVNGVKYLNDFGGVVVPASIANNAAAFQVGAYNGATTPLTGRASLCFLCANALPDDLISAKYYQERELFE